MRLTEGKIDLIVYALTYASRSADCPFDLEDRRRAMEMADRFYVKYLAPNIKRKEDKPNDQ